MREKKKIEIKTSERFTQSHCSIKYIKIYNIYFKKIYKINKTIHVKIYMCNIVEIIHLKSSEKRF